MEKHHSNKINCNVTSRYCNQTCFDIVICGGVSLNTTRSVNKAKIFFANNLCEVNNLPRMTKKRLYCQAVSVKEEIYVFGGIKCTFKEKSIKLAEKYSPITNTWDYIADMCDDRIHFSACSFMNCVYFIGGRIRSINTNYSIELKNCIDFNTKNKKWKEIACLNKIRANTAFSVFEGRIFVSGGCGNNYELNTVEAHDHVADKWKKLPDMIQKRYYHKSVAVKNKLFVVGGFYTNNREVYD